MWRRILRADAEEVKKGSGKREELFDQIDQLRRLGIDSILQAQILIRLARTGRLTALDLAAEIFHNGVTHSPSRAEYMRIVRALSALERRGYVARALFGKEKPYHITRYGEEIVTAVANAGFPRPLISPHDLASFAAAALIAGTSLGLAYLGVPPTILMACWFAAGVASGVCILRFVRMIRRVS